MKLFHEEFVIKSLSSAPGIIKAIEAATGNFSLSGKPFMGTVGTNTFKIRRVCHFINDLNPYLYGEVIEKDEGTEIYIKAEPPRRNLIFVLLIMAFILCVKVAIEKMISLDLHQVLLGGLAAIFVSLLVIIFQVIFRASAQNAIQQLKDLIV